VGLDCPFFTSTTNNPIWLIVLTLTSEDIRYHRKQNTKAAPEENTMKKSWSVFFGLIQNEREREKERERERKRETGLRVHNVFACKWDQVEVEGGAYISCQSYS
jgi:hypothetical protein